MSKTKGFHILLILLIGGIGVQTLASCSSDSDDDGGGSSSSEDGNSSSSDGGSSSSVGNDSSSSGTGSSSSGGGSISKCPNVSIGVDIMTCGSQEYRYVIIASKTWMAENLNYNPGAGNSVCYANDPANCVIYGRLYDWETANAVCPDGWHLPTDEEWQELTEATGNYGYQAGRELKAESGWDNCGPEDSGETYECNDTYGFSLLPGGNYNSYSGTSFGLGSQGDWWTSSESYGNGVRRNTTKYSPGVESSSAQKSTNLFSVRCVRN